jgi:hypothetical protein
LSLHKIAAGFFEVWLCFVENISLAPRFNAVEDDREEKNRLNGFPGYASSTPV